MRRKSPRKVRLGKGRSKSRSPNANARRDGRDPATGQFLRGNTARLIHGMRSARARQALLPGQEQQLAAMAAQRTALLDDLGGADALGVTKHNAVTRYLELQVIADTLAAALVDGGVLTPKGRQRAALSAYLSVVDRLTKLGAQLGFDRKAKPVPSIEDFLKEKEA